MRVGCVCVRVECVCVRAGCVCAYIGCVYINMCAYMLRCVAFCVFVCVRSHLFVN